MIRLTDEERKLVLEVYAGGTGKTVDEIAQELGVPYYTIYNLLRNEGVLRRRVPRRRQPEVMRQAVEMYTGGARVIDITRACHITAAEMYNTLVEAGIGLRRGVVAGEGEKHFSREFKEAVITAIMQGKSTEAIVTACAGAVGTYDVQRIAAKYGLLQALKRNDSHGRDTDSTRSTHDDTELQE